MTILEEAVAKTMIDFNKQQMTAPTKIKFDFKFNQKDNPDPRNWDKPSMAVVASDGCGNGCVLFYVGPHIEEEINAVGRQLSDLSLDDCPDGIWIWEGIYRGITYPSTPDHAEEYDTEIDGKFREPNLVEWNVIRNNLCPWDEKEWLKNWKEEEKEKSKCSKCKIDFADENLSVNLCCYCFNQEMSAGNDKPIEEDLIEQAFKDELKQIVVEEDKVIMTNYDLCNEQNLSALQKQEIKCSGCRAGLPLGSGRYHYDKGDITIPCTHNPVTGIIYDENYLSAPFSKSIEHIKINVVLSDIETEGYKALKNKELILSNNIKCECEGSKCKVPCADWCPAKEV